MKNYYIFQSKKLVRRVALFNIVTNFFNNYLIEDSWILTSASTVNLLKFFFFFFATQLVKS